jgi:putative FmdB family regulatory protein
VGLCKVGLLFDSSVSSVVTIFCPRTSQTLHPNKDYNSCRILKKFRGRLPMPVYDYICNDCHKEFEKVLTLNQHDHEQLRCPHCGSKNVEQEAKAFFAVTSKKS